MLSFFTVNAQVQDWEASGCIVDGIPTLKCAEVVLGNLLFMSGTFVLLVIFIMFIVGGIRYLLSFGDPAKLKNAQGTMKYALIGFALYMSAFLILRTIDTVFLGGCGKIFRFEIDAPDPNAPDPCL